MIEGRLEVIRTGGFEGSNSIDSSLASSDGNTQCRGKQFKDSLGVNKFLRKVVAKRSSSTDYQSKFLAR